MSSEARQRVAELLPRGRYDSLAEACVWADAHAREFPEYDWATRLHYVNVEPQADAYLRERDCPEGSECVVEAVGRFSRALRDPEKSLRERSEALMFLAHFVGDLHQPLHVAHPDNRGGNRILVSWFGRERDLHSVWDDEIPGRYLRRRYPLSAWLLGRAWSRHAAHLVRRTAPAAWLQSTDPADWANESLRLARTHTYDIETGAALDAVYYDQTKRAAMERIHQAGVRLGALLERLLITGFQESEP